MILPLVLIVAAALFCVGLYGALSQQVVVMVMMGLELMLNAVVLAAGALWLFLAPDVSGQVLVLVVLAVMTLEMAMGFAVAVLVHRTRGSDMTDQLTDLAEDPAR
ncbi:NAD(P)H-quinone oxidoreductase subunit 4L [Friedmanniella endophytica]|uniref:NADH-quinone oxidoreductase subunit K n=1 Tax=Microlunatus kandeliicorticis TaxID=1759536 RepID=A0A7W3P4K0_9ACTN|nr:NADH-quinone oxidoreductase subunit NuoK [Microlunatus kandeliicorticis]MBA8792885.1 NAD(P)H-quinone oxidoreductase subunit 4L [Microlunatus kandeliicorticis]